LEKEVSQPEVSEDVLSTAKTYTFEAFQLTSPPARLFDSDQPVDIRPRALQVLELLVSHAGSVVSRDELRANLWGAERFVDHQHGINTLLHEVRSVLGDDPQHPRYVETVRGSGYRFVASTLVTEEPLLTRTRDTKIDSRRTLKRIAISALLAVGVVVGVSWGARESLVLVPASTHTVIRIVPMEGAVSAKLARGLCENLKGHLESLLTAGNGHDFELLVGDSNTLADPRSEAVGRVDRVVASTLHVLPDAYRIELELVDPRTSTSSWRRVYELSGTGLEEWPEEASKDLALELYRVTE